MKKSIFTLFLALILGLNFYAQEPTYNWSQPSTNNNKEQKIDRLLAIGDDGFVLLKKDETQIYNPVYFLEYYNKKLVKQDSRKVEFSNGVMGNSYFIEKIEVVSDKIYAFIEHWDKKKGKNTLYIKRLTLDGTLVPGATVEPYQGVINPDPSDPTSLPNDLDPDRYTKVTGADGTVFYEFDNEVQIPLKVYIESINGEGPYEGVGEIKVEEDETVKRTITIYKTS